MRYLGWILVMGLVGCGKHEKPVYHVSGFPYASAADCARLDDRGNIICDQIPDDLLQAFRERVAERDAWFESNSILRQHASAEDKEKAQEAWVRAYNERMEEKW